MSEQRRVVSVEETAETPKTFLQKLLDGVERVGNKVPHPAVIFFILSGLVIVLSHLFYLLGTSVDYEVVNLRRLTRSNIPRPRSTACSAATASASC